MIHWFFQSRQEGSLKLDRFLAGILIGIGVLVIAALSLFFMRRGEARYAAEDRPEGIIQNYVLSLQKKDFEKAYGYLSEGKGKPDFATFREFFITSFESYNRAGLTFGTSSITGDSAFVTVIIQQNYGGPFNELSRNHETVDLVRQEGIWKIRKFPYPFWGYDWYQDNSKISN
jgi:hypothetical protein